MSIIGILASDLFASGAQRSQNALNTQSAQNTPSKFGQIASEFQQLGQDLQSGNVTQAQQDFTTLSQNLTSVGATVNNPASTNPAVQAFTQLGSDLQSGNLQAAQQDYTTVQQDLQQTAQQNGAGQARGHHHHHHHHRAEGSESSSSASSQQSNAINQAFGTLAQDLQAGNLSGVQTAFATLQNDLQQIGGFISSASSGAGAATSPTATGNLNVSA